MTSVANEHASFDHLSVVGAQRRHCSIVWNQLQLPRDGKRVSLTVKVSHVREREGVARVEIVEFNDEYSKTVLGQQTPEIDLRFNRDSIEFKDLAGAQYLPLKLKILATADCAIHRTYARKAVLTLCEVSHPRKTIDELHAMTQKLQCELDFDGKREESTGTKGPRELERRQ